MYYVSAFSCSQIFFWNGLDEEDESWFMQTITDLLYVSVLNNMYIEQYITKVKGFK